MEHHALPVAANWEMTVPLTIRAEARKAGLSAADEELLVCIARAESGFKPSAKNPSSTASGIFQFIAGTWEYTVLNMNEDWTLNDRFDAEKNIKAGVYLYTQEGPWPWEVWHLGFCP